jgi:hypothetical protein
MAQPTLRELVLPDPTQSARLPYPLVQDHTKKLYTFALTMSKLAGHSVALAYTNLTGNLTTVNVKRTDAIGYVRTEDLRTKRHLSTVQVC